MILHLTILNNLTAKLIFGNRVHAPKNLTRATFYGLIVIIIVVGVQLVFGSELGSPFTGDVVVSGSMVPTLQTGDFVIAQSVPFSDIHIGDVIIFMQPSPSGGCSRFTLVHRVVAITPQGLITQGDNRKSNPNPDEPSLWPPVTASCVKGKVVFVIPYIGSVFMLIPAPYDYLLIGLILLFVFLNELWPSKRETSSQRQAI